MLYDAVRYQPIDMVVYPSHRHHHGAHAKGGADHAERVSDIHTSQLHADGYMRYVGSQTLVRLFQNKTPLPTPKSYTVDAQLWGAFLGACDMFNL